MTREWEFRTGFFKGLVGWYFFLGLVANVTIAALYKSHDRHGRETGAAWVHSPLHWLAPLWLGPFAIAAVALVIYGVGLGALELWEHPPIRRVNKPVVEDLRVATRKGNDEDD